MPRPKRTKVAPPATPAAHPAKAPSTPGRRTQQKHTTQPRTLNHGTIDNSDDSDGLVTTLPPGSRLRKKVAQDANTPQPVMSGGLGPGGFKDALRQTPRTKRRRIELSRVARKADNDKVIEGLKKRREEALKTQKAQEVERMDDGVTGLTQTEGEKLDDQPTRKHVTGRQTQHEQPEEVMEQSTELGLDIPVAPTVESSMLAIANFKRRPRQPSILRMVQAELEEDEQDDDLDDEDDFNPDDESTPLPLSKNNAAHMPQKTNSVSPRTTLPSEGSSGRKRKLASPKQVTPSRSTTTQNGGIAFSVREDSSDSIELPGQMSPSEARLPDLEKQPNEGETKIWSDTMAPPHSSSSMSSSQRRIAQPHSKNPSAKKQRSTNGQHPSNRPGGDEHNVANRSSEPASPSAPLTTTRTTRKTKAKADAKEKALSTANLTDLLPRRRRRQPRRQAAKQSEFDVSSSTGMELEEGGENEQEHVGDGEDDIDSPRPRSKQKTRSTKKPTNRVAKARPQSQPQRGPAPKPKQKKATRTPLAPIHSTHPSYTTKPRATTPTQPAPKPRLTRGTVLSSSPLSSSDKENHPQPYANTPAQAPALAPSPFRLLTAAADDDDDDDSPSPSPVKGASHKATTKESKELREAARKFEEVDEWELTFEDVKPPSTGMNADGR